MEFPENEVKMRGRQIKNMGQICKAVPPLLQAGNLDFSFPEKIM